jgi:DNA-binding CsgD family transcriptional regulator
VDCSLLAPPQAGLDGRYRYVMLETLRAYGARLAAEAGEQAAAAGSLARYAVSVAEDASAGMQASTGELAAVRLLDAEDATMRQVLARAKDHDPAMALRLGVALGWWWVLRGRLSGQYSLLAELAGQASVGSGEWCAAQSFLGQASLYSADPGAALGHFTSVREGLAGQPSSQALADCLAGRSVTLLNLGQAAEAAGEGRRCLALSRELGYPAGEALALAALSMAACDLGDLGGAVQLARQFGQVPAGIPGVIARTCDTVLVEVLTTAGELTEASRICAEGLAHCREVGDLQNLTALLARMTILDLRAGRAGDAAAHLREELQIASRAVIRSQLLNALDCCGHLCAATRRWAEAVTVWAAFAAALGREGVTDVPPDAHRREEPLRKARQLLGPSRASAAEERGTAMNLATAAEYALMLTAPPAQQTRPSQGKLSARERELVTLVAHGRTNGQIAAELHISVRTVSSHLDRIRDKTGCRRRADLTRLALSTGLA